MGVSEKIHQTDGGHVVLDSEKWVISGISLRNPLKPVLTKPEKTEDKEEDEDDLCFSTTPTSAESRISSRLVCPPAPKKRKSAPSKSCFYGGVVKREFFNPPDLETIFIRRGLT